VTFNFATLLLLLVIITGVIYLADVLYFAKQRRKRLAAQLNAEGNSKQIKAKRPLVVDYARTVLPLLLIIFIVRSFVVQPYHVPSGSLEPTILPGDFIAVSQSAYGLRLPVFHIKLFNTGKPKRGDIAVFRWPVNPKIDFVKRIIGLPGDHIVYKNKLLYINGKKIPQKYLGLEQPDTNKGSVPSLHYQEDLAGIKHGILLDEQGGETKTIDVTVPKGEYFVMGDNRDASNDSRFWGFVPDKDLVGKAMVIWFSWDSKDNRIRWQRIGTGLS